MRSHCWSPARRSLQLGRFRQEPRVGGGRPGRRGEAQERGAMGWGQGRGSLSLTPSPPTFSSSEHPSRSELVSSRVPAPRPPHRLGPHLTGLFLGTNEILQVEPQVYARRSSAVCCTPRGQGPHSALRDSCQLPQRAGHGGESQVGVRAGPLPPCGSHAAPLQGCTQVGADGSCCFAG